MASSFESFKDLDLNKEEVERLQDALKDKDFRKLLVDYVEEITDPENQKIYQNEIIQLEKERGVDVQFINPIAGYVIKTSIDGDRKCFVNVCSNDLVQKPSSIPKSHDGTRGLEWTLPHTITPAREDLDNKKIRCMVYDVVFHPDTLHLAKNNMAFRNMVNNTACNAIETNFQVKLDKKNLKFPKLTYKGATHAAIIKKPSMEKPSEKTPEEEEFLNKIYATIPKQEEKSPKRSKRNNTNKKHDVEEINSNYTTPHYVIKHRSHVELEEFTEHKNSKMNSAIPKELVIEVNLPLLKSASDIILDVAEKTLQLISEKPAKYKLTLTLPYAVNQDNGNAKFDKDLKKIIITLPVKRNRGLILSEVSRDDSGVESDHGSPLRDSSGLIGLIENQSIELNKDTALESNSNITQEDFLSPNLVYNLPEYNCHAYKNNLMYTLNVKNVAEESIVKSFDRKSQSIRIKFTNISSGFYPNHYALLIRLNGDCTIDEDDVSIERWDNNLVLKIPYKSNGKETVVSYSIGTTQSDLVSKEIESLTAVENVDEQEEKTTNVKSDGDNRASERDVKSLTKSEAINIKGATSESSADELSYSYSPNKNRGILKRLSTGSSRSSFSRSISESSIDDFAWTSSVENCHTSLDSVIPENGEISTSLKKTVRFSNIVSKQLFRSNSSILGQKKKNQRKAKNKKKAQERRHSESELSECDEKKERDLKTIESRDDDSINVDESNNNNKKDEHIFDLDI